MNVSWHTLRRHSSPRGTTEAWSARYARWVIRWRWYIPLGWAVGLILLFLVPPIPTSGNELASIIPLDSPAIRAELDSLHEFGFPLSSRTAVVQHDPNGLSIYSQAESVLDAVALDQRKDLPYPLLGAIPITNAVRPGGTAGETNTAVLTYLFMNPGSSFASQRDAARNYIQLNLDHPDAHVVGVAGSVPARAEQARLVADNLPHLELFTVLAILILVGLIFRSVVAPVIALGAAGIAFAATLHLSEIVGGLIGIFPPAELEPLLVALLLGVVTDYTIFYVSALQSRIPESSHWRDAVVGSVAANTPIVVAAGLTVAAGTAALLAAESEFFRSLGPAMALAVVMGLAVSVTLVPALLAILGPKVLWPGIALRKRSWPGTRWSSTLRSSLRGLHLMERLTRRRVAAGVVAGCLGLLLFASIPLGHLKLGVGFTSSLPGDSSVARSARAASAAFAPGITSPTTVLVTGPRITEHLAQLSDLQQRIAAEPGVAGVVGPAQNFTQKQLNIVLSKNGNAARMLVVLKNDPLDADAITDLERLRKRIPRLAQQSDLGWATIGIGGDTALAEGLVSNTGTDLYRIAIAAILVNLFLLVVFLRALVAPLFLLASSVLAVVASLGLTVWVFMDLLGAEGLTFYVPFAAAVLLVSLGSDYNIFAVGRIWDEARHRPLRRAVIKAVPESARAITAAGVTLAVSFGMLATIPLSPFRELAFAMTAGILIDAFLVRSLLIPALLILVGPLSGWPGPNLRNARQRTNAARESGPATPDATARPSP